MGYVRSFIITEQWYKIRKAKGLSVICTRCHVDLKGRRLVNTGCRNRHGKHQRVYCEDCARTINLL